LHQRDNHRLISALQNLRDIGNSVIVVEHDKDIMLAADYLSMWAQKPVFMAAI
jgi:excinuclease ABC subunit A